MNQKLKELFLNPWFSIIILTVVGLVILSNVVNSCNRARFYKSGIVARNINNVDAKWSKLMLILQQVQENYVDTINYKEITEKTIPILLQSLDPHSIYLPPQDLENADESLLGNFSGIGVEFNVPQDTVIVINVVADGPSEKIGIQSGDRIVAIGEKNIAGVGFPQDSVVKLLRGAVGTTVDISVKRIGVPHLIPFTIKRDVIPLKSLDVALMIGDKIGYIKLSKFSRTTHNEFIAEVAKLMKQGMETLLLDLRDNPGGYMDQAFLMANDFLEKGDMIVYMEGNHRPREDFRADGNGLCKKLNLYIAINENSASSSEIVAGAIQDNDRGTIIGRRSFGKGLVQEPIYFSDSSGIRLTVARFYTPSGRSIQKPYSKGYELDIYNRYYSGELQNSDSIPKNDSLAFKTLKQGRTVYGGGGIIPDVFVPLDTVGVTPFLINVNRNSLMLKYSSEFADHHRDALSKIKTYAQLEALFRSVNLSGEFLNYAKKHKVVPAGTEWKESGDIIIKQLKGLIGRYSAMDTDAYYSYILQIDNLTKRVNELEREKE